MKKDRTPTFDKLLQQNMQRTARSNPKNQMAGGAVLLIIGIIILLWGQARVDYAVSCANNQFVYYDPVAIQNVMYFGNLLRLIGVFLLISGIVTFMYYGNKYQTTTKRSCPKCGREIPYDSIVCPYCKNDFK